MTHPHPSPPLEREGENITLPLEGGQKTGNRTVSHHCGIGVVLNLAVFFTQHTLLANMGGFDWYAHAAAVIVFIGMMRYKWGMIPVIAGSAVTGFVWKILKEVHHETRC